LTLESGRNPLFVCNLHLFRQMYCRITFRFPEILYQVFKLLNGAVLFVWCIRFITIAYATNCKSRKLFLNQQDSFIAKRYPGRVLKVTVGDEEYFINLNVPCTLNMIRQLCKKQFGASSSLVSLSLHFSIIPTSDNNKKTFYNANRIIYSILYM